MGEPLPEGYRYLNDYERRKAAAGPLKEILAVTDEPRAMRAGAPDAERAKLTLPSADKERLLAELLKR